MTVIDEYLQQFNEPKRKELERIREVAKQVVPDAKEVISYGMPALTYKGKAFLGFNVHTNHIGVYQYGGEEVVVISVPVQVMPDAAKELGDVQDKIIIDTSNTVMAKPEGFENGFEALTSLTNCKDIVKGFNTTGAENMANPDFNGTKIDMFV